ncbi:MAG TPA: hypothetical protein VHI10_00655, partial [Mycobacterium sp.]|nr:hypothetical protein [Mycobacterium sp.]
SLRSRSSARCILRGRLVYRQRAHGACGRDNRTGLIGMFITPLLLVGAVRLSRPHAPWARWRYTNRPRKMHRALERERRLRRPVIQAKLWLQHVIAGEPHFPDDAKVDEALDREIHPAPAPPERTAA